MKYRNGRTIRRRDPGKPLAAAAGITFMAMLATFMASVIETVVFQLSGG